MDNLQDNINLLLDEIAAQAKADVAALHAQGTAFLDRELPRARADIEQNVDKRIEDEIGELTHGARSRIAEAENEERRALLEFREELVERVFSTVTKRLAEYTYTDGYEQELLAHVARAGADAALEGGRILLAPRDEAAADKVRAAFGRACTVEIDPSIRIGGFKLSHEGRGLFVDETLENRLHGQRRWFYSRCGLGVTEGGK